MSKEQFDFDEYLDTDTPIEEEPLSVEKEPIKKKEFFNIKEKAFDKLKELLKDNDYIDTKYLDRNTCVTVIEIMDELVSNDGNLGEGTKSRDGFILFGCPKHEWAPVHICVDCRHWKGGRKNTGCCTATEEDKQNPEYEIMEKYTHDEAKRDEIKFRKEHGRYFAD